ncbi:MAG: ABC transporter permease [Gemmatimonadales bacterium]|nr:ABC transporter permease [Gemmatimonadales bacterium]
MKPLFRLPIRRKLHQELEDEFAFHLDMRVSELMARGWTQEAARAEARRRFGDIDDARAFCEKTDHRLGKRLMRTEFLTELRQDIGYAFRSLRRAPGFTLVATLTLALGIGATTAIFSVVRGIVLRPLPYLEPDRLALLAAVYEGDNEPYLSPANAYDWRSRNRSFSSMAIVEGHTAILTGAGDPERIRGYNVDADYFRILGVEPIIGRLVFTPEEAAWQGNKAVVLSEVMWRTRFGSDPTLIGRQITLDNERYRVVGVAPAERGWPGNSMVWYPFTIDPARLADGRGAWYVNLIGRLKPGVTLASAKEDLRTIGLQLEKEYPDANTGLGATAVPLHEWITGDLKRPLFVLLGGVAFVLLIACANVANLLLVRGVAREGELAVRTALGAGRGRLVRQLATESMVLSLIGAAGGLLFAVLATSLLVKAAPASIPRLSAIHTDGAVLLFAFGVSTVTGLLFGLLPARLVVRRDLACTIRESGRSGGRRAGGARVRRLLIVGEVALAVMLLSGAGLLIRSFDRLVRVDPGFRTEGSVSFALSLPDAKFPTREHQAAFVASMMERLRSIPGVQAAGTALGMPLTAFSWNFNFAIAGRPPLQPSQQPTAEIRVATPGYFATMGMPIVAGRGFTEADRAGGQKVMIISEAAALRFFPGENPLGRYITSSWSRGDATLEGEVIGVVGDAKQSSLATATLPQFWAPYDQWPVTSFNVVLHSARELQSVVADARRVIKELDSELALAQVKTLDTVLAESVAQPRFYMILLSAFAGVALLLSAIGIYGVIAYLVGQRTREIGIRVALGASRQRVAGLIVREGIALTSAGLVLGVLGALAVTRLMGALLFDVAPTDPVTFVAVAMLLAAVGVGASFIPALRAAQVDPAMTMRAE